MKLIINCYLIGTTGLLIKCAEILRGQGHAIEGIISPDDDVRRFAQRNLIPTFENLEDAIAVLKNSEFDYLFSIANPIIIPEWLLQKPRKLAINYHDSPLPKYAGVHATSWAILNRETTHGITWHEMVQTVDAGKILKQITFSIHENDTALSLNVRCYENAVKAFEEILDDIEADELSGVEQSVSDRSFCALHQKPFGGGVIDWQQDAAYISRLSRALYFGSYQNNLTRPKIILPQSLILYPQKIEVVNREIGALQSVPGTIVSINENGLSVVCKDGVIRAQELLIARDHQLSLSEILKMSGIKAGHILPVFSHKQLQYFTDFMQAASKDIAYWRSKLESSKRVNIPWSAKNSDGLTFKTTIKLSQKRPRAEIITYILICLNKLTHTETISFYYADEDTQKIVGESRGLACAKVYSAHLSAQHSIQSLVCEISNQLNYEKEQNKLLSVDAVYHTPERANIEIQVQGWENLSSMADMSFIIAQNGESIDCITAKNKEAEDLCSKLQEYFSILEQGCPEAERLGNITLNTDNEVKILTIWNSTEKLYSRNKVIHQLFEEHAEKTPDKVAIIYNNQQLSYQELNAKANQLAHYLKSLGVGSDVLVAVAVERSLEMAIGLLAILKAGGAYLPLDLEYPEDRLNYILEDTRVKVLLTTSEFIGLFSNYRGEIISLDTGWKGISKNPIVNLKHAVSPGDLVYIIYTSGTTGRPKGVGNTYQGLMNRLLWTHDYYPIASQDSFLYIASVGFDIAVWEMLFPLTRGASLIIPLEQEKKDIHSLIKTIDRYKVTNIHFVPSYLSLFIDSIKGREGQSLKQIITGGEAVLNELKVRSLNVLKNTALYVAYGPTEAAISVTHWHCKDDESINKTSIGTPISNTQIYILDANLNQVPIGAIGELFIGGEGLARGYLNKPGLTAEKFIANPFSHKPGERLYRTGDLARYLSDGNIEFIGRVDHQVKIRGFRIELGEIESAISLINSVKQVIVLVREDEPGQKKLVAYVVPNNQILLAEEGSASQQNLITDIRSECSKNLPDYMRPSQIMLLAKMPLTPNGKIDRKALPKPEGREGLEAYQAPQGLIENSLASIWKELLQVERIGRNDNFFHLGGDSIVGIHMVSRARKVSINFDVKQIFATPTIAGIIANSRSEDQEIIPQQMMTGSVTLLPVQEDFFAQKLVNKHHYNQSMWFIPTFKLSDQDKEKLKNCLKSIYHYHDTLRLRYDLDHPSSNSNEVIDHTVSVVQYYHEGNPFFWEEIVIDAWDDDILFKEATRIQQGLDIVSGPTSRVAWFESKDGYQGMLWVAHHLLMDGVSWRILLDDLNTVFDNKPLLDKTHSYQAFSNYLRQRDDFSSIISYYKNISKINYTHLKIDNNINEGELLIQRFNFFLSKEDTLNFIQKSHTSYNTQANDLLITALLLAIGSCKGTYDLLVDLEGHGREGELDVSRTLGWFTSMYPAYIKLSDPKDLSKCIKEVKEQLREIPEKGIGYGISVSQNKLSPIKGDLIFNYLGQWDTGKEAHQYFNFGYNSKGLETDVHNKHLRTLIIESGVQDSVLSFTFTYSNEYNKDTIVKLADAYKANLQVLINHCTNISNFGCTPSDFELVKISQEDIDSLFNQRNIQDLYPLVPIQSGLIFQYQFNPNSDAYFVQGIFEIDHIANVQHLKDAWQTILERYECLRSSFAYKTLTNPVQVIHKSVDILWRELDISYLTPEEQEQALEGIILQERQEGFDIQTPPLLRFNLLRRRQNNYYLIWNQHHLLTDGWSMPIILEEVSKVYESLVNNTPLNLKTRRPYKDYIAWINKQDRSQAITYWRKELLNITPTKIGSEVVKKANYIRELLILSESQTNALAQFAIEAGVTLNTVFQAVWSLILSQHTRQQDVTFGVTVSGRSIPLSGVEDMVGIFINTVPLRVEIRPYESLRNFLQRIQSDTSTHQDNAYLPLSEIQATTTARDLFDSAFVFENYPLGELDGVNTNNNAKRFHLKPIKLVEKIEYPIGVMVCPGKETYIHLHYQDNYFTREKIDSIKQGIISICEHLQTSDMAVGNIHYISQDTAIKLLQWNDTKADYPEDKCIHELFEEQVEKTPNNIAIVYEDQELTYQQLNEKANQLAHYLRSLGVRPDTLVAISFESSLEMVVGFLGILKAGGVYIPLDPSYPVERLECMLEDIQASFLITQTSLNDKFIKFEGNLILLNKEKDNILNASTLNPCSHLSPSNLAYIIFTSGSTGKPNGVMVGHKQLVNVINSLSDLTSLEQGDSFLQNVPFSFDPSLWSTIWPLTQGGYIILLDYLKIRDLEHILKLISDHSVKVLNIGPTLFRSLISMEAIKDCKTITHIIGGGEEWKYKDLQELNEKLPSCHFSNAYGPTETTIQVLTWTYKGTLDPLSSVPLGKPIANAQVYILDTNLNQLPIGISGELFIGGVGLARGYLNRPGLTSEKFIANPFSCQPGERLYRTGDLARYLSDGNIEFIGRVDHQVKIRGFRIELDEIESAISLVNGVKQVIVLAREDAPNHKQLVAYVVPQDSILSSLDQDIVLTSSSQEEFAVLKGDNIPSFTEDLRNNLAHSLPDYMIPSFFVFIDRLPLTSNGKVDRKALPAPNLSLRQVSEQYVSPSTSLEQELCSIWSEILKIDNIGIHDNFFKLGGHSLLATQVISRIRRLYNIDLPLKALFERPTIHALSQDIALLTTKDSLSLVPALIAQDRPKYLPLSFAQQRLWFLDQLLPNIALYNVSLALKLTGSLDLKGFEYAFNALIARHESLRTVFPATNGEAYQVILPQLLINIVSSLVDLSHLPQQDQQHSVETLVFEEANALFNLSDEPLIRLKILKLSGQEHILLITMHHIISDGWSMGIFFSELSEFYNAYIENREPRLSSLPIQYADFAIWQRQWLQGEVLEQQLSYWKNQLADIPDLLELPTDKPRPKELTHKGALYHYNLSKEIKAQLNDLSQQQGTSLFMTLLAIFQIFLYRYTGQQDIVVGSPIANRNHKEIEGLIGFFINTLALRTHFKGDETFLDVLAQVKDTTLQAYQHQDIYFDQLVDHLNIDRKLNRNPVFQVEFSLDSLLNNPKLSLMNLIAQNLYTPRILSKFDLRVGAVEHHEGIGIDIEYSTDLFEEASIKRLAQHFEQLIQNVIRNINQSIVNLPLLTSQEETQLLIDWNNTKPEYIADKNIHQLFEEQVEKTPDNIAVIFKDQELTYQQLNEKTNQLAHYLKSLGIGPDTLVAIAVERSLEMIIGLLGILKAGGAYVPLDPDYPQERLQFMLDDSAAPIILTDTKTLDKLPATWTHTICLDEEWNTITTHPSSNLTCNILPYHLAYVIYTSGSTGKPKGVLITHDNLTHYLAYSKFTYPLPDTAAILLHSSIAFDMSITSLFLPIIMGNLIRILSASSRFESLEGIERALSHIDFIKLTPTHLKSLKDQLSFNQITNKPKCFIIGGENLLKEDIASWFNNTTSTSFSIFNEYGPTEATVGCCVLKINRPENYLGVSIPIGRPISNTQIYILDSYLNPVPIGVSGEIYIGGVGLARGYLNRPGLTAEKFVPNPFSQKSGERLYRTGDLARYLPDGNIEFIGRVDHQVKIRGFRIEIGEIESVLGLYPEVKQCAVLAKEHKAARVEDGDSSFSTDKYLVAYYTTDTGSKIDEAALVSYLSSRLPDYMIPSVFMHLEKIPLTANGKLDSKALPEPEFGGDTDSYVAPRNETESKLCSIWEEVLGLSSGSVGIHDDFFKLGGNSIVAIRLVSRINTIFTRHITLQNIMQYNNVGQVANLFLETIDALEYGEI